MVRLRSLRLSTTEPYSRRETAFTAREFSDQARTESVTAVNIKRLDIKALSATDAA